MKNREFLNIIKGSIILLVIIFFGTLERVGFNISRVNFYNLISYYPVCLVGSTIYFYLVKLNNSKGDN